MPFYSPFKLLRPPMTQLAEHCGAWWKSQSQLGIPTTLSQRAPSFSTGKARVYPGKSDGSLTSAAVLSRSTLTEGDVTPGDAGTSPHLALGSDGGE